MVHLVRQVKEDLQETVVSLVLMDSKDLKERLAVADVLVLRDLKVVLVIQDELESPDYLELGFVLTNMITYLRIKVFQKLFLFRVLPASLVQKVVKDSSVQLYVIICIAKFICRENNLIKF